MGLFIDCHFLFELQLLCLSLRIEVLSFEDSEWSRGCYIMESQVEKLEHFPNIWAQPFLSFPYVSIKTSLITSNNTGWEWSMLFTRQSMTSKQSCTYGHPLIFVVFGIEHVVLIHPIFEPCPLNANIARWWNGHSSSHLPVLEYTDVDHSALMCLNDLHQTPKDFLNVECH